MSRPALDLFDAVFKESKRKNSENGRKNSDTSENDVGILHAKKSPFFKNSSKFWLRTLLYDNAAQKRIDLQLQVKTTYRKGLMLIWSSNFELLVLDTDALRRRTPSRPRAREQREREERVERDLARRTNAKIYNRCNSRTDMKISKM